MTDDPDIEPESTREDKTEGKVEKPPYSPRTVALVVLLVIIAVGFVGYQVYTNLYYLPFDSTVVRHDGDQVYIVAFGDVVWDAIEIVKANLERQFPELGAPKFIYIPIPESARKDFGPGTIPPLSADALLEVMMKKSKEYPDLFKMIAITEEPLYFDEAGPEHDIWGLTDAIGGNFAVVSTILKRKELEDEGFKPGTKEYAYYFDLSLGKSALHEFGHLMGLYHCGGSVGCPMEVVSPMKALEERGNAFCERHRKQLRTLYRNWGIEPVK